jgi:hypothetical protein
MMMIVSKLLTRSNGAEWLDSQFRLGHTRGTIIEHTIVQMLILTSRPFDRYLNLGISHIQKLEAPFHSRLSVLMGMKKIALLMSHNNIKTKSTTTQRSNKIEAGKEFPIGTSTVDVQAIVTQSRRMTFRSRSHPRTSSKERLGTFALITSHHLSLEHTYIHRLLSLAVVCEIDQMNTSVTL